MTRRSRIKTALYAAATVVLAAAVLEIGASWLMLLWYRADHVQNFEQVDSSYSSLVNLVRRAGRLAALADPDIVREETSPSPFFHADPLLGYSAAPGVYVHSWSRRNGMTGGQEQVRTQVTINSDGTRFVGAERPGKP